MSGFCREAWSQVARAGGPAGRRAASPEKVHGSWRKQESRGPLEGSGRRACGPAGASQVGKHCPCRAGFAETSHGLTALCGMAEAARRVQHAGWRERVERWEALVINRSEGMGDGAV